MTRHAELRCQERRISEKQLEWLLCYGEESYNRGVCLCFFDQVTRIVEGAVCKVEAADVGPQGNTNCIKQS
ncbi:DUF4258 domain-containing protein [Pseudomonas knackmussii]|uniref:DUF4258 domain-containing protein n=1 Tax=Pseudomonas knackmussii TaxID=65741 RepID=A0ABY4KWK9_9PSED|nr:DUF4258 domain-containing protein [Pseudomonas knackmussii]UPQ84944.1 DUF4258 domain-containing protein [Pseudomonas knackmussii]